MDLQARKMDSLLKDIIPPPSYRFPRGGNSNLRIRDTIPGEEV
jgi:hypothetical protein